MQNASSKKIDRQRDFAAGVYLSEAQNHIPPSHTVYCIHVFKQGRGRGGGERVKPEIRLEGQQFTKLVLKYQHD
jgi:hypothetical protein